MKILVVEDDLALADVLAFTLRRAGFDVLAVSMGVLRQPPGSMPILI
jgi:DNA-binding response OmpR family regulator